MRRSVSPRYSSACTSPRWFDDPRASVSAALERVQRPLVIVQVQGVGDADVAPGADLAVAVLPAGEERLRLPIGLHRLDRIAETPEEPTLIDQQLRFFARLHRLAGSELRVQVERALVGAEPLMEHGQVRDRHLSQARARALGRPRVDVRHRVLIQPERVRIPAAHVMHVADVVQSRDFAVAVATRAIQLQRPLIAGERVVVAAQVEVGEADRVEVPRRVRLPTEPLMDVERLLRLLNRRLVLAQRERRVGRCRERAGQRREIV